MKDAEETREDGNGNEDGKDEGMNTTPGNTAASDDGAVRAAAVADAGKVLMQTALSDDDDANDAVPRSRPDGEAGHPGGETAVEVDAAESKTSSSLKAPVPRKTLPVDPGVCACMYACV